jgi:hemerythrin-like metal-binding protein
VGEQAVALLNWKNDYSVGNAQIDADHHRLFDLINEFHYVFTHNRQLREIARVLNDLVKYSEEHFQREEEMMAAHDYPGLDEHREIHAALFETVFQLQSKFEQNAVKIESETIDFLRHWLTDHIVEHDTKFGRFLAVGG